LAAEPIARAALWSRRLAVFGTMLAAIGLGLVRFGAMDVVDVSAGLAVLGAGFCFACGAVLMWGAALLDIWRTGRRGARIAWLGLFLAAGLLAYPGWLAAKAVRLPLLADVTTDIVDPPGFSRSARALAQRGGYVPVDPPPGTRAAQHRAYPDIQPIVLDLEVDDTFDMVLATLADLGWKVVDETRPGGRAGLGHIDAVVRSRILGLPDDVTIRVQPLASQTRVDVRSASRYGRHDFGSNADRIRSFTQALLTQFNGR
jgi:uncharacterized protein (DUF1499 family)